MKRVLIVLALMFVAAVGVLSAQSGAKKIYELTDEITKPDGSVGWKSKEVPLNVESLPRAFQFLQSLRT